MPHHPPSSRDALTPSAVHAPAAPLLDLSSIRLDDLPVAPEPRALDHDLMVAVHEDSPERVRQALAQGADPNVRHPVEGINALHIAAEKGRAWAIPLLIQAGADVERPTGYGTRSRPLGLAVRIGLTLDQVLACTTALLNAGADPNAEDAEGMSPFRLIVTRYEEPHASCENLLKVVDQFLAKGAGQRPDGEGNTAFHWFLVSGHPRVAQHLLSHGLPWAGNRYGETALDLLQYNDPLFGTPPGRPDPFEQAQREREAALKAVFEAFLLRQSLGLAGPPDPIGTRPPPPRSRL